MPRFVALLRGINVGRAKRVPICAWVQPRSTFSLAAIAEEPREKHMHESFAKDVDAFRAVLGPLWHARPGKERSQEVGAKATKLENLARGIRMGDTKALLAAIAALEKQCQISQTDIDAAFFDVHQAFHYLAEPKGR